MVEATEKRSVEFLEELEKLRLENCHQSDIIAALECQISLKDKEIDRLHRVFEEGQPFSSVPRNCCSLCQQKDGKIRYLEEQLKMAVLKQHEAMNRALHLAERNQRLERELKDIDNMALAVEAECQNKVKQNFRNIDVLEGKLRHKIDEIKKLEGTIAEMKNKILRDEHELDSLRANKKLLEKNLNFATNEKKELNDKVNHFLIIEKNLKSEISRLEEINRSLQRKILDMEVKVADVLGTNCKGRPKGKQKPQSHYLGTQSSEIRSTTALGSTALKSFGEEEKFCCNDRNLRDYMHAKSNIALFDKLQQERNFYHNECHRLKEIIGNLYSHSDKDVDLIGQLKDKEKEIKELKQEAYTLRRENCVLLKRFECGDHLSCSSGDSIKIILDKLEKERDMALSDISRLQGERDALKEKIKIVMETQMGEQSRFEKIITESEERIRRLESERREFINSQSSQRVALATMEEKLDEYKEQARCAQTELVQMTANYNQIKALQEQTDRTLSDVQGRLSQTGIELRIATNKIKELEKEKEDLEREISVLKKEKFTLKASLAFIEKEKDGLLISLDEKTERVAKLENDIKKQETYISDLTEKITHLEKKFECALNEKTTREHGLRALERTVELLKEELEQCERHKEVLIRENRRLQDDLAAAAKDCFTARKDLDAEKQEVENLKKQLQQYVTEVKRAEELLTKKEIERNQMLDHFRSLSLEATALETNNHTLESTVENTKTQLISSNNKILDLEEEISSKDSLLCGYEKQIAELTTQIAELETKLKQQTDLRNRAETDLAALRDLCSAIDSQKEALRKQAGSHDAEKTQLMNEMRRLSEEYEGLNEKLTYERSLSQTLEKSLTNSRQETLEHKITNKDLQAHVQQLRQKVDELTQKLESESQDVRRYQTQCAELSQQVTELRREVTNARFEQAKAAEDSRRNVPQTFEDGGIERIIRSETELIGRSARNIPPLMFPEDSDRTFSFDSDSDYQKFCCEEPRNTFSRFDWKLSPLVEKSACGSKTSTVKADTASELSSLPEDSEPRDNITKICVSGSDDKITDLSAYPTYSVHGRSESQLNTYNVEEGRGRGATGIDDEAGDTLTRDLQDDTPRWEVGDITGKHFRSLARVGSCSESQVEECVRTPCRESASERLRAVTMPEFASSPSNQPSELSGLEESCGFQSCADN